MGEMCMRMKRLSFVLLIAALCSIQVQAQSRGEATLQAWMGHDAGELLAKWHIDRGFTQWEDRKTGQTAYSWLFGISAHYETRSIFDGQTPVGTDGNGGLIIQENYHNETNYVPLQQFCTVTFFADSKGILSRYVYTGARCGPYAGGWGKPKAKKN